MAFVEIKTLCLKLWNAIITFVRVKKLVRFSQSKKVNEALKRES